MSASILSGQIFAETTAVTSVSSVSVTATGTTAHNAIPVFVLTGNAGNTCTGVSGSVNGAYTPVGTPLSVAGAGYEMYAFLKPNIAGGSDVITATFASPGTQYAIIACECGDVALSPLDGFIFASSAAAASGTNGWTTGSGSSSTNANEPALLVALTWAQGTAAAGTGFTGNGSTFAVGNLGGNFCLESLLVATTTAQSAQWTLTVGSESAGAMLVILDQLAAPVAVTTPRVRRRRIFPTSYYHR